MLKSSKIKYFRYGDLIASILLKGAVHLDLHPDNVMQNYRGDLKIVDYSEVLYFKFPDEFTEEVIRQLALSVRALTSGDIRSFGLNSCFRAGYMAETGFAGLITYDELYYSNYSSFLYTNNKMCENERNIIDISDITEIKEILNEWRSISSNKFMICKNVRDYKNSNERSNIKFPINRYYLDNSYFIYRTIRDILGGIPQEEIIDRTLFFSESSLEHERFYTAYGLAKRCKLLSKDKAVCNKCDNIILATQPYVLKYASVINKYLNNDIFELLWIMDDLDRIL